MNKTTALLTALLLTPATLLHAVGRHGPDVSDYSVPQLIDMLENAPDMRYREAAAEQLGRAEDAASGQALFAAFQRSSQEPVAVRTSAAYALLVRQEEGHPVSGPVFETFVKTIADKTEDNQVREAAAYRIYVFKNVAAIPALLKAMKVPALQEAAIESLGELKAREAVGPITEAAIDAMERDGQKGSDFLETNSVMIGAVEALGKIGDVHGMTAILPMLGQGDWYRRQVAVEAVAHVGENPQTSKAVRGQLVVPVLAFFMSPLNETNSTVRMEAVFGMAKQKDPNAIPTLEAAFRTDPAFSVREAAANELKFLGAPGDHDVFKDEKERMKQDRWDK